MKQKYTILRDDKTRTLTIQEYAELSKELFSLICEETYSADALTSAMGENKKTLIDTLRTPNLYPVSAYIDKIADKVIDLFENQQQTDPVELIFDDVDLFRKEAPPEEKSEDESVEIEDLLEDDSDDSDDSDVSDDTEDSDDSTDAGKDEVE